MRESKEFETLRKPRPKSAIEKLNGLRDKCETILIKTADNQSEVEIEKFKALLGAEGTSQEDSEWLIGRAQEIAKTDKPTGHRMINLDDYIHYARHEGIQYVFPLSTVVTVLALCCRLGWPSIVTVLALCRHCDHSPS